MKHILHILTLAIALSINPSPSQGAGGSFRAAWIATVANIDWPQQQHIGDTTAMKADMQMLLDSLQAMHFNAIIFQIRPTGDALYSSTLEPASHWLWGKQHFPNENDTVNTFDALRFVLSEAHARQMEVHVWLNPYRAVHTMMIEDIIHPQHILRSHPEWFFSYGGQRFFDPGRPETRAWICDVVEDIVCRYPVDAIHMDDYFYPYPADGKPLPDQKTFERYNHGFTDIRDWRRDNVNRVIQQLSAVIHTTRPGCRFGISPFGVWRNKNINSEAITSEAINALPEGSATKAGITNYDDLYADILLWMREGWIDYCVPQLYWEIGKKVADYEILAHWWAEHSYGCTLYIGLSNYRLGTGKKGTPWCTGNEIMRQLRLNDSIPEIKGECFYSTRPLLKNPQHICDSLKVYY